MAKFEPRNDMINCFSTPVRNDGGLDQGAGSGNLISDQILVMF